MSTHFTIPVNRSPCSGARYQVMPSGLTAHMSEAEYGASMARIQAANRATLGVRAMYGLAWVGYMLGLLQLFGLFNYFGYGAGYSYDSYYVNGSWVGLSVAVVSFVALIALGRYMRKQRAAQVAAAVQVEHIAYQTHQPQLAWRVINESLIEIDVVVPQQQEVAALHHQVHMLQAQVAAQAQQAAAHSQHHAIDHELIAHQAAAAAAHHARAHPAPAAPAAAPAYYPSVVPVAEPVYAHAVYQPAAGSVFAHPPPQYYTQPRNELRAPLVQPQYQY